MGGNLIFENGPLPFFPGNYIRVVKQNIVRMGLFSSIFMELGIAFLCVSYVRSLTRMCAPHKGKP